MTPAANGESSSPNRARLTNCPEPAFATSSSPSTRISPRRRTISGEPVTSVPSKMFSSDAEWWVAPEMVSLRSGSKTMMSASEPTAIVPFFG